MPVAVLRLIDRLTMRHVLLAGFGLVLALGALQGVYFARRMAAVQVETEGINRRYAHAQELLTTLRTQVLLGSIYVRDALLDQAPESHAAYRRLLEITLRSADEALHRYEPVTDSDAGRETVRQLTLQVADFRQSVLDALPSDAGHQPREARLLLRTRIIPKRQSVIRVFEDVEVLNRGALTQRQAELADVYRTTQRRVWWQSAFLLGVFCVIGVAATRRVEFLETRLYEQQRRDAESARDLQRLSSQLVTAQEDERRTIARELHDEVGQVLTAIKVELAVAQRAVDHVGGSPTLLGDARSITDNALHTVRNLSQLLHPAMLDDLGLVASVDALVREFRRRHDIRAEFLQAGMTRRAPQAIEVAAYRLVQEALTNVARHAQASTCRVELQGLAHTLFVTIEDDGVAFDESSLAGSADPARGLGLLGMRERVAQLRGSIRVDSWPGRGTRVAIVLPSDWRADTGVSTRHQDLEAV